MANIAAFLLGSGLARAAARRLAARRAQINNAVNRESNGQAAQVSQTPQASQTPKPKKRKQPRSFFASFGL